MRKLLASAAVAAMATLAVVQSSSDAKTAGGAEKAPGFAAEEAARFTYVGYLGGVKVGLAKADIALSADKYAAKLNMQAGGMVSWFLEWRHGSVAHGAASGGAPLEAVAYRNDSYWKGKDRFIELAYPGQTAKVTAAVPDPVKDEGRPAVAPTLLKGALDPLSAIIAIGRVIDASGKCDADLGVFDGRRLYRLKVADKGAADLNRSRYAPYAGASRRCQFEFERIAGFKDEKKEKAREPLTGLAYFRRPAAGAPMMPVRVSADSQYGAAVLHLRKVELLDPQLAAEATEKLDDPRPE